MDWLNRAADGSLPLLSLHQPGAKDGGAGLHGEAPEDPPGCAPVDAKANAALIAFWPRPAACPSRPSSTVSGETSRTKRVRLTGVDVATVEALVGGYGRRRGRRCPYDPENEDGTLNGCRFIARATRRAGPAMLSTACARSGGCTRTPQASGDQQGGSRFRIAPPPCCRQEATSRLAPGHSRR